MIRAIISLLASGLTALQVLLLFIQGKGVCFNDGCEIVDSLTRVSPLVINTAGFVYFQLLFWLLLAGRNGADYWHKLARLLLLAGLAAEAVLLFFQYRIAMVFCSYCLVIFSVILLLNILSGIRQAAQGVVLFAAVLLACLSVRFEAASENIRPLTAGSIARLAGREDGTERYLFFSSTCPHCEKILGSIAERNTCGFRFNPVDTIPDFQFDGAERTAGYDPIVNARFLKRLGVTGVPALLAVENDATLVLQGERRIMSYLDATCRPQPDNGTSSVSPSPDYGAQSIPGLGQGTTPPQDGVCPVNAACPPDAAESGPGQESR